MNFKRSNIYKELHPSILENPKFWDVVALIIAGGIVGALIIGIVLIGH